VGTVTNIFQPEDMLDIERMKEYEADVTEEHFHNTVICQMMGTPEQISQSTDLYSKHFPIHVYDTMPWGDAQAIGILKGVPATKKYYYELIIMRLLRPMG